jgi:hypothetical protein
MHRIFFAAAGFYLLTLAVAAQTSPGAPPGMPGAAGLPPGEGRDATIRVCGKCHDAGIFANQALDAEGWKPVVDEMAKMSDGTDDDFAAITRYLTKAFPAK